MQKIIKIVRENFSAVILMAGIVAALVINVPETFLPTYLTKVLILTTTVCVVFATILIKNLQKGHFPALQWNIVYVALILFGVSLTSAIASAVPATSLWGFSLDIDTAIMTGVFLLMTLLVGHIFSQRTYTPYPLIALGVVYAATVGAFLVQYIASFAPLNLPDARLTLVGNWYDFGIFMGFYLVLFTTVMTRMSFSAFWNRIFQVSAICAGFLLSLLIFPALHGVTALIVLLLLYSSTNAGQLGTSKKKPLFIMVATALIAVLLMFVAPGIRAGLLDRASLGYVEVRPSWTATMHVIENSVKESPLLGFGPNKFEDAWTKYAPVEFYENNFWSLRFNTGVGFLPSKAVTQGLIGFLAWLGVAIFMIGYATYAIIFSKRTHSLMAMYAGGTLYFWVMAIFYPLGFSNLLLMFLVSALFLSSAVRGATSINIDRSRFRDVIGATGYVTAITLIIFVGVVAKKYLSQVYFVASMQIASTDTDAAVQKLSRALSLSSQDVYYRAFADYYLAQASNVAGEIINLPEGELASDQQTKEFNTSVLAASRAALSAVEKDNMDFLNRLKVAQVHETLLSFGVTGSYESALSWYQAASVLAPQNPLIPLKQGNLAAAAGDFETAVVLYNKALSYKRNYTEAAFALSQAQYNLGNLNEAVSAAESATGFDNLNPVSHFRLGTVYYGLERYEDAIVAFNNALTFSPQYANARYFRAITLAALGQETRALEELGELQAQEPNNTIISTEIERIRQGVSASLVEIAPLPESETNDPDLPNGSILGEDMLPDTGLDGPVSNSGDDEVIIISQ